MAIALANKKVDAIYGIKQTDRCDLVNYLSKAEVDVEYTIKKIKTDDEEIRNFLFTLGCYEGEKITVISKLAENYIVSIKDARYSIDTELAEAIIV